MVNRILNPSQYPFDANAQLGRTDQDAFIQGEDAINQMIAYLLATTKGTRTHQPLFGSNIPNLLFEPVDQQTGYQIQMEIYDVITLNIPYIKLVTSQSYVQPIPEEDSYFVSVVYVNTTNSLIYNYTVVIGR